MVFVHLQPTHLMSLSDDDAATPPSRKKDKSDKKADKKADQKADKKAKRALAADHIVPAKKRGASSLDDSSLSTAKETKKKKKNKSHSQGGVVATVAPLPPHKYILAPMVGGSELAFRLLCRRYATRELLCYTPMIHSERFATEPAYRAEAFQTCAEDRPLVAHFCGNDPAALLAAAKHIQHAVDAIDLNLGCPQRIAHSGHFGSYLLDEVDRPLVCEIVRTLAQGLVVPVFCKVRLLDSTAKTIELCQQLRDAGARLIAIHARHRVNLVGRSGPSARDGPALLDEVVKVRSAVSGVRLVTNGNVRCWEDAAANLQTTSADGVMSAEGMLDDPALFFPTAAEDVGGASSADQARAERKLRKKLREIENLVSSKDSAALTEQEQAKVACRSALRKQLKRLRANGVGGGDEGDEPVDKAAPQRGAAGAATPKPAPLTLAREYLELAEQSHVPIRTVVFHIRRMAKQALNDFQLMADMLEASDLPAVRTIVEKCVEYQTNGYTPDPEKAAREREALELKKWREATRKRFEERMVRKAKREGLPRDHYLSQGAEVPTGETLREMRAMPPDAAWQRWKTNHGQHCWAMHMGGGCTRERTCAFLHADVAVAHEEPAWHG